MGIAGCDDNKDNAQNFEITTSFGKIPLRAVPKKTLPSWLIAKVNELETPDAIAIKVCRGQWKNQTVYYIENPISSCMFCDLFYENGTKIKLGNELVDFHKNSTNWVCIYVINHNYR
ncbi:MAG: hypothetical protein CSA94_02350 [Bacteroidetes bacterium]|nr:MAG: hypothetical protein CSA94_02350 [Bacteroidota bacterium]